MAVTGQVLILPYFSVFYKAVEKSPAQAVGQKTLEKLFREKVSPNLFKKL